MAAPLQQGAATTLDLLLPPVCQILVLVWRDVNLEGERERRLHLVVDPIQARAGARVADLLASRTERALAMLLVQCLQDLHHRWLIPVCQVARVVGPRHVHATCTTVDCQESRRLELRDKLFEDPRFGLRERVGARVRVCKIHSGGLPLLVPIAVQIDSRRVLPDTIAPRFHLHTGARVAVEHELERVIIEHLCNLGRLAVELRLAAKCLQEKEAALGADQLAAVLAEQDEDTVRGARLL
mmetsp:Transcript_82219/g.236286  ORF Transcript_82219/g.236286 Transcript_82219/m.236286 type:complete len:240 (-) Transcript_82219:359-1078(-)